MVQMSRLRSSAALAALVLGAVACGSVGDGSDDTIAPVTPVPTLGGVGSVPAMPSAVREPVVVVRPPVDADGATAERFGEIADGNRILMIGDSILASTSSRYGNHMCDALVPLGWEVGIEAEPSRFVEFGNLVLDRLLPDEVAPDDDWDAAVVFLGSNYRGDAFQYEEELVEILDRLAPRPVLLFTVTEYRPNYVEVNEVVKRLGAARDHVTVLDWKTVSETPGILSGDRLHPTDTGRRAIAESVAAALGPAERGVGDCLRSTFRDDSAAVGDTRTVLGRPSTGSGSSSGSATTTTIRPTTSPTTTSTAPPTGTAPTTIPSSTVPPATAAPNPSTTSPAAPPTNPTAPPVSTTSPTAPPVTTTTLTP
jgi:hypothetical protein